MKLNPCLPNYIYFFCFQCRTWYVLSTHFCLFTCLPVCLVACIKGFVPCIHFIMHCFMFSPLPTNQPTVHHEIFMLPRLFTPYSLRVTHLGKSGFFFICQRIRSFSYCSLLSRRDGHAWPKLCSHWTIKVSNKILPPLLRRKMWTQASAR